MIFLQLIISLNLLEIKSEMTFKDRWRNYKSIGIFCIVFILFLIFFMIWNFIWNKKNEVQTEKWIDISEFPTTLEIDKEWKLLSYPEVTILAEADGKIATLNVSEWDIVEQRDILMQIWDENWLYENTDIDITMWKEFAEYYQKKDEYNQFELEFWEEISKLEKELRDKGAALSIAIDTQDKKNYRKYTRRDTKYKWKINFIKKSKRNFKIRSY